MIGFMTCMAVAAITSKVAVESIVGGVGLGMSIYTCSLGVKSATKKRK